MRVRAFVALVLACSTLAPSSWAADVKPSDCVTASEASLKLRDQHRLKDAREQLLLCASPSCPVEIREECVRRIDRVKASIPTIVFEIKDAAGNDLSAVKVSMDGHPFADQLDGTAIAVDPGAHTFRFESAGQPAVEKMLVVREAEKNRHEAIVFGGAARASGDAQMTSEEPSSAWSAQKTVSLAVAGVGVVGLAVGGIFGGVAASKWSSAKENCFGGSCPNFQQAVSDQQSASDAAVVSTVGFIVGGAAVAAAVVLWLTAPSGAKGQSGTAWNIAPGVGPRGSAVLLQRAF